MQLERLSSDGVYSQRHRAAPKRYKSVLKPTEVIRCNGVGSQLCETHQSEVSTVLAGEGRRQQKQSKREAVGNGLGIIRVVGLTFV